MVPVARNTRTHDGFRWIPMSYGGLHYEIMWNGFAKRWRVGVLTLGIVYWLGHHAVVKFATRSVLYIGNATTTDMVYNSYTMMTIGLNGNNV